jgi:branched-chain amino acid transport system permease protein
VTSSTPESSTGPDARVGPGATNEDTAGGKTTATPAVSAAPAPEPRGPRIRSTLLKHSLLMLLAFVGIALLIETLSPFRGSQLAAMAYYVPTVAGLTVLTGLNGQISLGHGALMAVGAYTTALMLEGETPLPYLVILAVSVLLTALVGVVVGAAASRLHGPYLAGATLALAVVCPAWRCTSTRRWAVRRASACRRRRPRVGGGRRLLHHRQRPDRHQVPRLPRLGASP